MPDAAPVEEAVEAALRALHHRDRSAAQLDRRLEASGVEEGDRRRALELLERTGLVDDRRFAESRAASLAARGAGDALIRHDLAQAGVDEGVIADALSALESEHDRAGRIAARRGPSAKTARYLVGKGFAEEVVHSVIARDAEEALG